MFLNCQLPAYITRVSILVHYNSTTNRLTTSSGDEQVYLDLVDQPGTRGNADGFVNMREHDTKYLSSVCYYNKRTVF